MTNCAPGEAYNFVMDIIYIDRLFFLNLVLDYLIVLCSARLCGIRLRRARYAAAAGFGALYAALSYVFCRFCIIRRSGLGNIAAKRRKLRLGSIHTCFASGADFVICAYLCSFELCVP